MGCEEGILEAEDGGGDEVVDGGDGAERELGSGDVIDEDLEGDGEKGRMRTGGGGQ
jgi:hypothetical protein